MSDAKKPQDKATEAKPEKGKKPADKTKAVKPEGEVDLMEQVIAEEALKAEAVDDPEVTAAAEAKVKADAEAEKVRKPINAAHVVLGIIAALLLAIVVGAVIILSNKPQPATSPQEVEAEKVSNTSEEPPPLLGEGVESWQDVLAHIKADDPPGYGEFVTRITGLTLAEIEGLAALEKSGYELKVKVPKGTVLTNTGLKGGFQVYPGFVLKTDREALTTPDGKPQVLTHCGNPIGKSQPPSTPEARCPPAPDGFDPRTPDGGSKVFQPPQDKKAVATATDPAPGIVRGKADAITKDQAAKAGTDQPTTSGADNPTPATAPPDDTSDAGDDTDGVVPSLW